MKGRIMDTAAIQDEALHFIQQLDAAAFEAFTVGHISGERYRDTARQIGTIQRITVDILYGVNGMTNAARE
jgi:hypothetical protein